MCVALSGFISGCQKITKYRLECCQFALRVQVRHSHTVNHSNKSIVLWCDWVGVDYDLI